MKSLDERIASGVPDGILKDITRGRTVPAWLCDGTREDGTKVQVWMDANKKMLVIKGCEKPFWEFLSVATKTSSDLPKRLPSKEDFEELLKECRWEWNAEKKGMNVIGPNGNSIFLPAEGYSKGGSVDGLHTNGYYWAAEPQEGKSGFAVELDFDSVEARIGFGSRDSAQSVRLVASGVPDKDADIGGFVDLGLPSGLLWAGENFGGVTLRWNRAIALFGAHQ